MTSVKLPFFSKGEISPKLHGRVDTAAYQSGLKTARNAIVQVGGGIMNRPGTVYISTAKYNNRYTRLIPFVFKVDDTHMLEVGHEYIRFIREDFYQLELVPNTVTGVTNATEAVVTSPSHGWVNGDTVRISDVVGMTEINDRFFLVSDIATHTFKIKSLITGDYIDSTNYGVFSGNGEVDRIYEIETPYQEEDLPLLRYAQSADVLTLVHPSYPPKELRRSGLANWSLASPAFTPATAYPEGLVAASNDMSDLTTFRYQVTSIDDETGIESLPGLASTAYRISAATKANPCVVTTAAAHNLVRGDAFFISNVSGMTELNDKRFLAGAVTTDTVQLAGVNSTGFTTFTSALTDSLWHAFAIAQADVGGHTATITWTPVDGIDHYAVYRETNGLYEFIGETRKPEFTDTNIEPTQGEGPPKDRNPFEFTDTYPGAVGFFEQRRIFGGSISKPDGWYASKIGDFSNFSNSTPLQDDDAITASLVSEQVNEIKHIASGKGLFMFTSGAEWSVTSGGDAGFGPFTAKSQVETNWGIADHRPILLGRTTVFVQGDNRTVRSFGFTQTFEGFESTELSLISDHMFQDHEVKDCALARYPYSAVVFTRTDGDAALMVLNEEQRVVGWTRWDTQGDFLTVGSVKVCLEHETPEPDDGIYFVVKRKIGDDTVQFVERLHKRRFTDVRDAFFVDCGVSFDNPYEITAIDNGGTGGRYVITCPDHPFTTNMVVTLTDIEWVPDVDSMGNETQPEQLNDTQYIVDTVDGDDFTIRALSSVDEPVIPDADYNRYVKGGAVRENVFEVSGLDHLEGMEVSVAADGYPLTLTVEDGAITLPGLASRIHVGLGYTTDIETLPMEYAVGDTTSQNKKKRVTEVTLRLNKSRECLVGPDSSRLSPMRRAPYQTQVSAQLYTGDNTILIQPNWNTNGRIFLRVRDPLPLELLGIYPKVDITT